MKSNELKFNREYYKDLIKKHGYDEIDFEAINFSLNSLNVSALERKFVCHHHGDIFAKNLNEGKRSIVTTGFGLSGHPHLGSISEMLKMIEFQKAGLDTQIVLGDLDSYNARKQSLPIVRKRVESFTDFILNLGYKDTRKGIRDQYSHQDVIHTAYLVSHYLDDKDFEEAEEDLSYLYKDNGIYKKISFPMKMALLLMVADFIHLGLVEGYENILITLGIEEHKYVLLTKKVVERMGLKFHIGAMYGKIIKGLSGYPKMCKSIKGSAIDVTTPRETRVELITSNSDSREDPEQNAVYQMMEQTSRYDEITLDRLHEICKTGSNKDWLSVRHKYAEDLNELLEAWPKDTC